MGGGEKERGVFLSPVLHREREPHSVRTGRGRGRETGCQISDEDSRKGKAPDEGPSGGGRAGGPRGYLYDAEWKGQELPDEVATKEYARGIPQGPRPMARRPERAVSLSSTPSLARFPAWREGMVGGTTRPVHEFAKRRVRRSVPDHPPVTACPNQ